MQPQMTAQIGNFTFKHLFLNASGVYCRTKQNLDDLLDNQATGGIVTKSATLRSRKGNPNPRYHSILNGAGSINSMGLPNYGLQYYLDYLLSKSFDKPTILSVAGTSFDENIELLKQIQDSDYQGMTELNLSCPNVVGKPQIAYDFETTNKILTEVFKFFKKPIGVKLPPYFDLNHFDQIAKILNQFPLDHVNSINSVGNGLWIDIETESVVIKPKKGFGGIGGKMVLPTGLANVRALRERLKPSIKMIGTGGITSGKDVFAYLLCGADLVSVGTQLGIESPKIFNRLESELAAIMVEKGYTSVNEFRGKLKSLE
ncbi:dihydroorotate dehydrogenase [Philodulcilactobacillus myokoensis]|uniref:Dihydroorotate dehydrogenase n=1 Tax=Philodulcilactobacillus myokoensis TaxID=2929573 RepID=A0A9W6EU38_9LACO|nr:dihydroorotate oxidase [Philodulcilactobacillus myokoensis]GLB47588.1 dihydroorotate dehydrogenase [Philodulcilactobacillus myokoensis]